MMGYYGIVSITWRSLLTGLKVVSRRIGGENAMPWVSPPIQSLLSKISIGAVQLKSKTKVLVEANGH